MTVYFTEFKIREPWVDITSWDNPPVIPCIGDSVFLETETEQKIIQRLYVVVDRRITKDSVRVFVEYDNSETIIPKNEQRTN